MTVAIVAAMPTLPVVVGDASIALSGIGLDFGSVLQGAAGLPSKTAAISAPTAALDSITAGAPTVSLGSEPLLVLPAEADGPVAVAAPQTAIPAQPPALSHVDRPKRPTAHPGADTPLPTLLTPMPAPPAAAISGTATLTTDLMRPKPVTPSTPISDASCAADMPAAEGMPPPTEVPRPAFSATPRVIVVAVVLPGSSAAPVKSETPEPTLRPIRPQEVPTIEPAVPPTRTPSLRPAMPAPELPNGNSDDHNDTRPGPARDDPAEPPQQAKPGTTPLQPWALAAVTLEPPQHTTKIRTSLTALPPSAAPAAQSSDVQDAPGIALRIETRALGFVAVQFAQTHPQPDRLHVHFVVERANTAELIVISREGLDRAIAGSGAKLDGVSVTSGTGNSPAGSQGSTMSDSSSRSPRRDQDETEERQRIEIARGVVPLPTRDRYA